MAADPQNISFEIAFPNEKDAKQVMDWRNDPVTRAMSFHQEYKTADRFYPEFKERYFFAPDLPPLFILLNGVRSGFLAFEPIPHPLNKIQSCCEVSIQIAPQFRGQGLGSAALHAIHPWILNHGYDAVYAEVKAENTASQKMFTKAGYQKINASQKRLEDTGEQIPILSYLIELASPSKRSKVFIIAEAGSNWRTGTPSQDIEMAFALIDAASEAGADAVKFQTYRAETLYVKNAGESRYLKKSGFEEDIFALLKTLEMPYEMLHELANHCKKRAIEFMSTSFSPEAFLAVDPFVKRHKIASYEITHTHLLELAAQSGKPLFLSTGTANESEIAWALKTFRENGGSDLTLLQCTASYPAPVGGMNLNAIPWMRKRFKLPVGLSDHSLHPLFAPIAAVALGASVIEKHFTMDRHLSGPDHAYAILPKELKEMVAAIRETEKMLGQGFKNYQPEEEELRLFAKRGVQATKSISKGALLQEGVNIEILRPGNQRQGIHPRFLPQILGKKAARAIPEGDGIQHGDWE